MTVTLKDRPNFDEYVQGAKNSAFYGHQVDSLDRDELLYMIHWLMVDQRGVLERVKHERQLNSRVK